VLGALPGGASAPSLEAPTLSPTAQTMGELPSADYSKTSWARWAIPLILAAIVAAAATYEWMRPAGESRVATHKDAPAASAPQAAPSPPNAPTATSLPNPLASNPPAADAAPSAGADTQSASPPAVPSATVAAPATDAAPPPAAAGASAAGAQAVDLVYRDTAWTEIRDRDGRVLLTGTNPRGTAQTVSGAPPLKIVIGNALNVTLRYKGEPVDLTPFTQKNVAQFTLP